MAAHRYFQSETNMTIKLPPLSKWKSWVVKASDPHEIVGFNVGKWYRKVWGNVHISREEMGPEYSGYVGTTLVSTSGSWDTGKQGSAAAVRKALQAWSDQNPGAVKPPKKKKKKGIVWLHDTPSKYSHQQMAWGMAPKDRVRLKIVGGTDDGVLFQGYDSKGRSRYELIPPTGQTARDVAREFKKAAKAGQKVLGGTIYAIRFVRAGKEGNYWKATKG
jgi:hypothetical protein